jgi:undecaprenyl-diphosphatase
MTGETDAQLVARVRRGDRAAAGALAERYLRACRAVALAVTHYAMASSYPSGHATMSMVLLVVLAYIVHQLSDRRWPGVAAMLLAGAAVLLIGLSRLYLGVHYPSDVIAGYAIGFAWAVFCALAVEALRSQRRARERTEG